MFLRLFLTLLLMAGLTVDFHTMSLSFGTAAYAFDDEEDEYEDDEEDDDDDDDDDGDDDFSYYMDYIADGGSSADYYTDIEGPQNYWGEDNPYTPEDESVYYGNSDSDSYNYSSSDEDCTFCGMNNVNDFVNYIESGQAARDGITGHVWTDPHEFTSYASEHQNIMDAVISSGGSFDYESCDGGDDDSGYSSSGSSSESTESGSHNCNDGDGANDSGTSQGHGNTNADANNGVANDSGASQDYGTQNQNLLQTDQERIDATKSEIMNSNLTIKDEWYDASTNSYVFITYDVSKVETTNVDGISVVNYEPAYGKVSVELSPRESNTENTETATPVSETPSHHSNTSSDVSNDDSNDSGSSSVNYGNGGNYQWNSGNSGNNGNSNSWNYGNSGNSGNSGNNHSGNSGDSGSIETISADDEGEYESTDNTPSTTEPEPTTQEEDYECEGEQCDICGGYKSAGTAFRSSGENAPNCPACTCVKTPMPDCDSITTYTGLLINTTEYKAALESMRTLSNSGTSACRLLFDNGIDEQNGLSRNLSVGDTYSDLGSAMSAKKSSEDVVGVVYSVGEGQHMLTDRQMLDLVKYSTQGFSTAYVVDGSHVYAVRFENFNMSQTYLSKYEGYIMEDGEFNPKSDQGRIYGWASDKTDGVLEAKSAMYNYMGISLSLLQSNTSDNGDLLFSKINSCYSQETGEVYTETCGEGGGK